MDKLPTADHRKTLLRELLDLRYGGSKAGLGRALGYRDGAFVGQMLRGERPISEKTVDQIHAIPHLAGWFAGERGSADPTQLDIETASTTDHVIHQYANGGAMGKGLVLEEQPPGIIRSWSVSREWIRLNVPLYTSLQNICIVTGFGPSMRPLYNPGDPLLMDRGVKKVDQEGVFFFRVGEMGYIKQLQRIPTEDGLVLRAKSLNPSYEPFNITRKMQDDFECFGKILTAWKSEQV